MDSTRLLSEGFENAAYALKHAFERFEQNGVGENVEIFRRTESDLEITVSRFADAVAQFEKNVTKYVTAQGMVAENQFRLLTGKQIAYTEADFLRL